MPDTTKKPDQPDKSDRATDKVDDLPRQPISDRDAQAIKGGVHPEPKSRNK